MRRIPTIILFLLFIFPSWSQGQEQPKELLEEAISLNQRALDLSNAGNHAEAIPYVKKSLEIQEQVLGEDHQILSLSLQYLATLCVGAGRPVEAEPFLKRGLEIQEKALGKDHLDVAKTLDIIAEYYVTLARLSDAELLYKRSLEIKEKNLGKDHPDAATNLNNLAMLCHSTSRYDEAEPLYKRSLEIREKALGKDHPDVARSLNNLAFLCQGTSRFDEAETLYKKSLEIRETVLGKDHPDVAESLNSLGNLYETTGRHTEAEALFKRSLEIREKVLGKDHPSVAAGLDDLAKLYLTMGRYADAEPLYKRSLEIKEKALGKDHADVMMGLTGLALVYWKTGRCEEAIPYAKRVVESIERLGGQDDQLYGGSIALLAFLYGEVRRYAEAEPLYKRSLEITERTLGKDHPDVATSLHNLAILYQSTGRYEEAEPLYKRSLEIMEKALGKDHPDVATSLNNLANLYADTGRYEEAEPLYKQSLEIRERVLGRDHPDVAAGLNSLAKLYADTGRYAEAEPVYKRSLEIRERVLGKDHPDVAESLHNLAILYERTGRYEEAEPLYKQSLEIREKALGKDHPGVAASLNSLAILYVDTGRYAEAEPLYERSLEIRYKAVGKEHPNVAASLNNLAFLYANTDRHLQSHALFSRGIEIEGKKREDVFLLLSEKQKLTYVNQKNPRVYAFVSHTVRYMQSNTWAVSNTFDAWLRWKGAVMEAQGRYMDVITHSEDPEVKKKFEELMNIRREIARIQLLGPGKLALEDHKKRLEEFEKRKASSEVELGRLSKDFAMEKTAGKADTKAVSEALLTREDHSVYIDFANIKVYDFKEKRWNRPRYLAFVLLPAQEPVVKLIDLSEAEEIDTHIQTYQEEMARTKDYGELPRERVLKAEAKALYEALIKPLEPSLQGKKHIYISPDGNLNLIPFEVLMTPEGKYLMEDYIITYVSAGRDIMRFQDTTVAKGPSVIIADPDYDLGLKERVQVAKAMGVVETRSSAPLSRDARGLRFTRLPDTKQEADAIEKVLRESHKTEVKNYQDKQALEEVLFKVKEPRILHLATHGYFLRDEETKVSQPLGFMSFERERMPDLNIENPMLRSGIVLAGVNASLKEGRDDGVVSAEKILGIRLKGTELVVLSACETGVGDIKNGEGVFGLKRAFILSGAKTVVMSLWSVPSKETTELMTEFYTLMAKGKTKAEAFREARLNLMKKQPNPFYWGAFVLVGNPN